MIFFPLKKGFALICQDLQILARWIVLRQSPMSPIFQGDNGNALSQTKLCGRVRQEITIPQHGHCHGLHFPPHVAAGQC